MNSKAWLAVACLLAGIPLTAWGLTHGAWMLALLGLALLLAFWAVVWQWIAGVNKPQTPIKPAARSAWSEFKPDAPAPPAGTEEKK